MRHFGGRASQVKAACRSQQGDDIKSVCVLLIRVLRASQWCEAPFNLQHIRIEPKMAAVHFDMQEEYRRALEIMERGGVKTAVKVPITYPTDG